MKASVIVPARDAEATLPRTLRALAEQDLEGAYEVIVVDDGSSDRTAELARSAPGPVTVLAQPALGPAAARNLGVARSGGAALAFCDADVFPTSGWLRAGVGALERADLVQGHVLPDPSVARGPFDRSLWITSAVGLWETASLFVSREVFERTGGFEGWLEPRAGKALAEDVWFGWKAQRFGARSAFCADALAYHAVFSRDWRGYVAEQRRAQYFPAMAARMPELRERFLAWGLFLTPRSALFDLGVLGGIVALMLRSPLPLAAAVPYLRELRKHTYRTPTPGPDRHVVAAVDLAADLVGLGSMILGSVRYRCLVL